MIAERLQSGLGILVILAVAWLLSNNRQAVSWRRIAAALALTVALSAIALHLPPIVALLRGANGAVDAISEATRAGTSFVFGHIGGGPAPYDVKAPGNSFILAFQALPVALVVSVITTLLFYWGILPPVVRGFSFVLERLLGVGGAVGLATAANIFVGMVEGPMFIRPYLAKLTRSELFIVMTGGMAGIAGTVFVVYATILRDVIPDVASHLIVASVLGAPAAILIAQLMMPETEAQQMPGSLGPMEPIASSTMDAIVKGTTVGLELLLNIVAMLIVLVALVHLVNAAIGLLPQIMGAPLTLQRLLGAVMAPLCWLMGIPWAEAPTAGALMGTKTILNEFIAYLDLAALPPDALSPRSRLIMLYAMCGFANLGSLGIMVGGLTALAPGRRDDILKLGPRTVISGTLSTCLIGALVGALS
ncbi:NupC/NupG family nucleoside CNT transporter [Chelatococcus reniformis]|uniref:Nucleoside:proton symporter n=1 Tax=Chelatococcus reniformis TaxID=1494448 RepID=A0A916XJU6_9HYPH|nr:nucleoside transporter C-terminal domain-containing protein [Chelatococcus reniformis]GGC79182.1 nucleoside:proton symporter [Chelatococcus reniformis]